MKQIVSTDILPSIKKPMHGGPRAEAKTVMATTKERILPRCLGPYNSAHKAVIPVYIMPTFKPRSRRYGQAQ